MKIKKLAGTFTSGDEKFWDYLRVADSYGRIKYEIVQQAWVVMLKGLEGDKAGSYDKGGIKTAFCNYEALWKEFAELKANNEQCATLYQPFGFSNKYKDLHSDEGMDQAVRIYEAIISSK